MKEYTILSIFAVIIAVLVDKASRINILKKKFYYLFLSVIFCFKLLVNGYLTAKPIVNYSPYFFLGIRVGTIPLEDFLFGFSMVTLTIIFWERLKR